MDELIEILFKNKEYFLLSSIHIFTDLIIFSLLSKESQNIILFNLESLFRDNNDEQDEEKIISKKVEMNQLFLEKLLYKLLDLIFYYPLSNYEIKEINRKKQVDIILYIIKIIFEKIKDKEKIIFQIKIKARNLFDKKEEHKINLFFEDNKLLINKDNSIIDNEIIKMQIESLNNILNEFIENTDEISDKNLNKLNDENKILNINGKNNLLNLDDELNIFKFLDLNNNINNEKIKKENKCSFCQYINVIMHGF